MRLKNRHRCAAIWPAVRQRWAAFQGRLSSALPWAAGWHCACRVLGTGAGQAMLEGPIMRALNYRYSVGAAICLATAQAQAGSSDIRKQAEAFSGQAVALDPRLSIPACPEPVEIAWRSDARSSLLARCRAKGWSLVIPVALERRAAAGKAAAIVRRGQPVQVMANGNGFRVLVEGIAERDGRAGERLVVRNLRSGRRMLVDIGVDGGISLASYGQPAMEGP